jgi:lactate permease
MLAYHQNLDPLGNSFLSTALAASPVVVLFVLLVPMRWLAPKAGLGGAITALVVAIFIYGMQPLPAFMSFVHGVLFGLLPVGWTIFNAMLLYNITVEMGQFSIVRRSVAGLSGDARIQAILIGFAFGAFLEGSAGGGTPVAICAAIMVGLGFDPFLAAVLCLIANTSPVAYGGLGTPLIVLTGVTDLPTETLSVMAGHQLPIMSFIIPLWMTKVMCTWRQTWEVWPALLVSGGSFALFQYVFATMHTWVPGVVLYPMTDIGGGIFSLVVTALFLRFWRPKQEWHFPTTHALPTTGKDLPLTAWRITIAWAPFALMSILLLLTGLVRQQEGKGPVYIGPIRTNYLIPIPWLHQEVHRDAQLHAIKAEQALAVALASTNPLNAAVNVQLANRIAPKPEKAEFNFAWLTAPGTAVFGAVILSMLMLQMSPAQIWKVFKRTCWQMQIPIPTIALMLGLSYVTRYAGMDATLGIAFAATGILYPFFAAILGWLGVFLTGTDAGSNALFGSLQKITATEIHNAGWFGTPPHQSLNLGQAQVLICTSNSTGGVMGKMIDAQSICVATAATHLIGREADIFKAVVWHSIALASLIGLLTLLQAYVWPFTLLVPGVP